MKRKNHLVPFLVSTAVIGVVCFLQALPSLRSALQPQTSTTVQNTTPESEGDFFQRLEWMLYDWRTRIASRLQPPAETNLGAVLIDDSSATTILSGDLGYHYGLLWPRDVYARLTRELTAEGARAIAFDVLFAELRPDHDKLTQSTNQIGLTPDQLFADELRRASNVILAAARATAPVDLFRTNALALGEISSDKDSDGILRRAKAFHESVIWHAAIRALAKPLALNLAAAEITTHRIAIPRTDDEAAFEVPLNEDGSLNLKEITGEPASVPQPPVTIGRVWHMGIVLAAHQLKLNLAHPDVQKDRIVLRGPNNVERVIPTDRDGYFYIDWTFRYSDPRLTREPIEKVLSREYNRERGHSDPVPSHWRDKLVVVGSTATGSNLSDIGATPLEKDTFLLSKYWNVANSVLTNRFIQRSSYAMELSLIIGMGALAAFVTLNLRVLRASFCVAGAVAVYVLAALFLFVESRYWLPVVLPVLGALLMNHVCLVTYRVLFEQKERSRVKSIFTKIVSPEIVNELLNADTISLVGARREVTVLFADLRDFTEFTEATQAAAQDFVRESQLSGPDAERYFDHQAAHTLATVNAYLSQIADTVKKHRGTLDKYIGDCVMAFWGAPATNKQHAADCVRAAIEAHRSVHNLNEQRAAENRRRAEEKNRRSAMGREVLPLLPILTFGTGINTGKVTVGLMGSDAHGLNYTVFGHDVNLASRLEAVSGSNRIVISESTFRALQKDDPELAQQCLEQAPVSVKGIRQPVRVFEVRWRDTAKTAISNETPSDPVAERNSARPAA